MKKMFFFVIALFFFLQCQETNQKRSENFALYHRSIGSPISINLASEWISNYLRDNSPSKRIAEQSFSNTLTAISLASALNVSENVIGATFQNALDSDGAFHILFVPFIDGLPFANDTSPIIDMSTGLTLGRSTAEAWTDSYRSENESGIRYYFFGRDVLDEILATPSLATLEALPGLTNEGEYKLVLLAHQAEAANSAGRMKGASSAYDNSCPCPNTCAE